MKTIALIWGFALFAALGSAATVLLTPVQVRGDVLPGVLNLGPDGMWRTQDVKSMAVVCGDADPFDDPEGTRERR